MPVPVKTKNIASVTNDTSNSLKRILGNDIVYAGQTDTDLARGIQISSLDIISDTISAFPDGKTYFHFCPVADGDFYIILTFFPELNPKQEEEQIQVIRLTFDPEFFHQWDYDILHQKQPFRFDRSSEQAISLPPCCFEPISHLADTSEEAVKDFSRILQRKESAIFLLRTSLNAYLNSNEADKLPACSFLSNSQERDKVMDAYKIIMDNLESPKTIRTLSRMVGMNECYLKKGFKVTFGKTIHEFQQIKRIEKAKDLLKEGKYSVNEVAFMMGFGSASHFSSSFKKIAGLKPCELLG
ncbi:MAG TPA: helix-turn-helix domain-containing protein [Edaphocola sp.]|nr:helix-turn-helix domain-containing protein [Edaphocola sp.]